MMRPNLVVAADWGTRWEKRWMARATWSGQEYILSNPYPVGYCKTFVDHLRKTVGPGGTILAGFDFPVGLPAAYANAQFSGQDFRTILQALLPDFFTPGNHPTPARPFGPESSGAKALGPDDLATLLGLNDKAEMLRACDKKANAHPIFHTLGPRQVGRAAAQGWSEVLQPSLGELRLWPFDGPLTRLLEEPGVVVAEIYPALAYRKLGGGVSALKGRGKESPSARRSMFQALLGEIQDAGVNVIPSDSAKEWAEAGFASSDDFDATCGALGMLRTLAKGDRIEPPTADESVRRVEGWMLGLE